MVVNGFWYGSELGELEKLCIESWIQNGYEFYLWVYDLDIEVPDKVVIANANHIVQFSEYFTYDEGHSKGTPIAFSNLFRAELLYQRGGLYTDLDVLCLKPYDFNNRFVFSEQVDSGWDYHVATCILYSENAGEELFKDWIDWIIAKRNNWRPTTHGDLGPNLLTPLIISRDLKEYVGKQGIQGLSPEVKRIVPWKDQNLSNQWMKRRWREKRKGEMRRMSPKMDR